MNQIKLVFSDIDGTLLDSQHRLTDETKAVIRQLTASGVSMVLASARPPHAMAELAAELQLNTPLVCYNGALIVRQDETNEFTSQQSLPVERLDALLVYQILQQHCPEVSLSIYSNDHWYVDKVDAWHRQETAITGFQPEVLRLKDFLKEYHPVHKFLCMGEPAALDAAVKNLDASGILDISYYRSKDTYLEITNHQVSKLTAMNLMAQALQIEPEEIFAIGDNYNDLPMILSAGIGVAMGNAPDEVKQAADYVTKGNNENGVFYALASLLY